jgi:hypothetical protein
MYMYANVVGHYPNSFTDLPAVLFTLEPTVRPLNLLDNAEHDRNSLLPKSSKYKEQTQA